MLLTRDFLTGRWTADEQKRYTRVVGITCTEAAVLRPDRPARLALNRDNTFSLNMSLGQAGEITLAGTWEFDGERLNRTLNAADCRIDSNFSTARDRRNFMKRLERRPAMCKAVRIQRTGEHAFIEHSRAGTMHAEFHWHREGHEPANR